jgi:hypothetical protein
MGNKSSTQSGTDQVAPITSSGISQPVPSQDKKSLWNMFFKSNASAPPATSAPPVTTTTTLTPVTNITKPGVNLQNKNKQLNQNPRQNGTIGGSRKKKMKRIKRNKTNKKCKKY